MPDTWGQGSTRAWRKTRLHVLQRDRYQCQLAGPHCTRHATEVDHVLNIAATHTPRQAAANPTDCQAVCRTCHDEKTHTERRAGRARRPAPMKHPGLL